MGWQLIKLGDAATFINGYAFKPEQRSASGKEIIRIQNLTNSLNETNYFNGELKEKFKVRKGDLLISWSATIGIFEWYREDAWLNQHIFKVEFNKKEFDKGFFKYLISSSLRQLDKEVHGSTMKHITKKRFDEIKIPLPPLETQKKIASILAKADELRQNDRKILEKYDQLAQSVFMEMFGDTQLNQMKWPISKIEELAAKEKNSIKAGPFGSSLKKEYYSKRGYKIYGQEQVIKNDPLFGDYYINDELYSKLKNCKVQAGDILISLVGTYGKLLVIPEIFEPGIINPRLMKITLDRSKILPLFFKHLFLSRGVTNQISSKSRGGTMDILNIGIIKKVSIPVPPIDKQVKFLEIISKIEIQKHLTQQSLQKSEELFQSLMQRAFRGEIS
jgi:type I restriction enzyme S subunit